MPIHALGNTPQVAPSLSVCSFQQRTSSLDATQRAGEQAIEFMGCELGSGARGGPAACCTSREAGIAVIINNCLEAAIIPFGESWGRRRLITGQGQSPATR
ncbi:MAG: hypothetical protein IPN71_17145 [Fibrobacteres bacterium]|nr:hypothetical protein [Fibrobacterota bacterium]